MYLHILDFGTCRGLEKLLNQKYYLVTAKVKSWMEGLISKHLALPRDINVPSGTFLVGISFFITQFLF